MGRKRRGGGAGFQLDPVIPEFFDSGLRSVSIRAEDFRESVGTAAFAYQGWRVSTSGAGAAVGNNPTLASATHMGIVEASTGTTATGLAALKWSPLGAQSSVIFAAAQDFACEMQVLIPVLSTGAETYRFIAGYIGNLSPGEPTNGVYFEYDSPTSPNWRLVTANGGARTKVTSAVAVAAGAWVRLGIRKALGATSFEFLIGGASVGSINTNIPASDVDSAFWLEKSVGVTARTINADYFWERFRWSPPR